MQRYSMRPHLSWWHVACSLLAIVARLSDAQPLFYAAQQPDALDATTTGVNGVDAFHVDDAYWAWIPQKSAKNVGLIYYTHLFYDERAYSRIMQKMAEAKYPSFLLDIPWSMSFLTPFRGDLVLRDYPEIEYWVVAGHAVGGSMASLFAQRRRVKGVEGLALFGAQPFPLFNDQSLTDIKAISIWGNRDGITPRIKWEDGRKWLPQNAKFREVDGANHSQMARLQVEFVNNDNPAALTRDQQEKIVVDELKGLMAWVQAGTQQPTNQPSSSPTKRPTPQPVLPTTAVPTRTAVPETRIIPARFGYTFETFAIRQPTQQEIDGLRDATATFFKDTFLRVFPTTRIISSDLTNVAETFEPGTNRIIYDFDLVVVFNIVDVAAPEVQALFNVMAAYDEDKYIQSYVQEAQPSGTIFSLVEDTSFATRGGSV
jgi:Alpha/beta hydrolase family